MNNKNHIVEHLNSKIEILNRDIKSRQDDINDWNKLVKQNKVHLLKERKELKTLKNELKDYKIWTTIMK